ncbi:hypothetical protein INR49_010030 [Caranx melampygus]|nr:hypothetical protein INR49_010030 [Caranx melampygus]
MSYLCSDLIGRKSTSTSCSHTHEDAVTCGLDGLGAGPPACVRLDRRQTLESEQNEAGAACCVQGLLVNWTLSDTCLQHLVSCTFVKRCRLCRCCCCIVMNHELLYNNSISLSLPPHPSIPPPPPAASSSWLQEHVADLSRSLCGIVPGLSSVLLPRMNPFVLINMAGALSLCITYMLIEINNYNAVDTASAVAIALMTFGTMYPMSVYSGKVLLQTTPSHIIGQLDKLLREVSTLDGVLEVRNEHFWTVGFGSLAGSAHVRIRRDANEQLVLAHVTNRLLPLVSTLTVQIFKDDWTRPLLTGTLSSRLRARPSDLHAIQTSALPQNSPLTPGKECGASGPPRPGHHTHRPYGGLGLAYGASPYTGMLNQGLVRPGGGLGLGVQGLGTGFGMGVGGAGVPSSQSYRTAFGGSTAPLQFGTNNPLSSQYRQYRP